MTRVGVATLFPIVSALTFAVAACYPPPQVVVASSRFLTDTMQTVPVQLDMRVPSVISLDAEPGSYVVVARVTNRLLVQILYPKSPLDQKPYSGSPGERTIRFQPGVSESGGVYAVASDRPFDFSRVVNGTHWPAAIRSYQDLMGVVVVPRYAQKVDVVAGLFLDDITTRDAKVGYDAQLYDGANSFPGFAPARSSNCGNPEAKGSCQSMSGVHVPALCVWDHGSALGRQTSGPLWIAACRQVFSEVVR
jgi:hypothetical protein